MDARKSSKQAGPQSNAEWELWGEVDPLWGVASWPGKKSGDSAAWSDEEFFRLGEQDWADFRSRWDRYGLEAGTCVEIGCGAGRMTRAMASTFRHVHGLDVSAGMLDKASQATAGLPVTLHRTNGLAFPLEDNSAEAVFSTHVFQHLNDAEDAAANWREAVRVLKPGGTLLVHLPVHFWPGGMQQLQAAYAARRAVGDLRAAVRRRRMATTKQPIMRGQSYEWSALEGLLRSIGLVDVELAIFRLSSNDGQHTCVLARKG